MDARYISVICQLQLNYYNNWYYKSVSIYGMQEQSLCVDMFNLL